MVVEGKLNPADREWRVGGAVGLDPHSASASAAEQAGVNKRFLLTNYSCLLYRII